MAMNTQKDKKSEESLAHKTVAVSKSVLEVVLNVFRSVYVVLGLVLAAALLFGGGLAVGFFASLIDDVKVPSKAVLQAKISTISTVSQLTYQDGQPISNISSDLIRTTVASDQISKYVKQAIVATEDENFYTHNGFVPKAFVRAVLSEVLGIGSSSGGSTLTQQLVKQQILGDSPTFERKASEMVYAVQVEKDFSKDQILTDYLNVSPFGRNNTGGNIAGVEEAAKGIFGKTAADLTLPQAAFIAGLPQSPIVYSPYNNNGTFKIAEQMQYGVRRQQDVLFNMYRNGDIDKKTYTEAAAYDITKDFLQPSAAPTIKLGYLYQAVMDEALDHVASYLMDQDKISANDQKNDATIAEYHTKAESLLRNGGYTVKSTVNKQVHDSLQAAIAEYGYMMQDGTGSDVQVGTVIMDNKTGGILGFIGGLDYASNQNNHALDTQRSPGSSIKPLLVYGPAIDQGLIGSESMLSNYPAKYSSGQEIMHVGSKGTEMMTAREALDVSWNIPAVWLYRQLLNDGKSPKHYLDQMNFTVPTYQIESLPMGSGIENSVATMTNGYATLANEGKFMQQHIVESITDSSGKVIYQWEDKGTQLFSKATASIMNDMLRSVIEQERSTYFKRQLSAINPSLYNDVDWTGKSGTGEDWKDYWLMLSTPTVSMGTWVGHDDNRQMGHQKATFSVSGNFIAHITNKVASDNPNLFGNGQTFQLDPSVNQEKVVKSTGTKSGKIKVNGKTYSVSGEKTTSLWATKEGAPQPSYYFGIPSQSLVKTLSGEQLSTLENDYEAAWLKVLGRRISGPKDLNADTTVETKSKSTSSSEGD
jgi:penicillin-binding protein